MKKEEMIEKIESHPIVRELIRVVKEINEGGKPYETITVNLVGGAVVDILEDREPNDFDFSSDTPVRLFSHKDFVFIYETKTAKTYLFEGNIKVQLLKVPVIDFEYKISQSVFTISDGKLSGGKPVPNTIKIDETSFWQRTLIPTSFENIRVVRDCLMRIPHWKKKGYEIRDETYLSLMRTILNYRSNKS